MKRIVMSGHNWRKLSVNTGWGKKKTSFSVFRWKSKNRNLKQLVFDRPWRKRLSSANQRKTGVCWLRNKISKIRLSTQKALEDVLRGRKTINASWRTTGRGASCSFFFFLPAYIYVFFFLKKDHFGIQAFLGQSFRSRISTTPSTKRYRAQRSCFFFLQLYIREEGSVSFPRSLLFI